MLKYVALVACLAALAMSNKLHKKTMPLTSSSSSSSSSSSESSEEKLSESRIHMKASKKLNHQPQIYEEKDLIEMQAEGIAAAYLAYNLTKNLDKKPQALSRHGSPPRMSSSLFEERAVTYWVQSRFLKYFRRYSLQLSQNEITQAINTYNSLKYDNFVSSSKVGVLIDMPNQHLEQIIDDWVTERLIGDTAARRMKFILDSTQSIDNSEDFVLQNADGSLVFTRFAYISTITSRQDPKQGTVVFMFRTYKFKLAPIFHTEVTNRCFLWGMICDTQIKVTKSDPGLSGAQATDLANYMQYRNSRDYDEQAGSYIDYLLSEAKRYERFQPELFRDDWNKIDQHPDEDPSKVVPQRNALDATNYLHQ